MFGGFLADQKKILEPTRVKKNSRFHAFGGWLTLTIGGETLMIFLFLPRSLGEHDSQLNLNVFLK